MRTAVFYDVGKIVIEEFSIGTLPKDKILIKIDRCAICTWEQRVFTGVKRVDFPFIGGHEIAGEIVEIGQDVLGDWRIGDKVVFGTNLACGTCHYCRNGEEQNCLLFDHSKQQGGLPYPGMGGLSECLVVDPNHIFKYSNVSASEAALIEPLSCVIHSIETADIHIGDYTLIIGAGIMGMLHLLLSQMRGAITIVSDLNDDRLQFAKKLGASFVINPQKENLLEKVSLYTKGLGVQNIFSTVANPGVIPELLSSLSNTGVLVLYSSYYPDSVVGLTFDHIHKAGQSIRGTANSNKKDFIKAARLVSYGLIDMKPFINSVYPLSQIETAFKEAVQENTFRIIIDFEKERGETRC